MLSNIPKNLAPKFTTYSRITQNVSDILSEIHNNPVKIPNIMGMDNPEVILQKQRSSYNNANFIAQYQNVDISSLNRYLNNYKKVKYDWATTPFNQRKEVFLKAADLLTNKYYDRMLAYTIAGQNKTIYEAEIDAICELVDFLRFNVAYCENIHKKQPITPEDGFISNTSEYNPLNGFVAAITPFNFTAIGGNLASAPLMFGNSVLWKPSNSSVLSNYLFYEILIEAGLPRGILNFCPMEPELFFNSINKRPDLGALLFTGSSEVFDNIYQEVGKNIKIRNNYTRLIGETGGKNFHFVDDTYCNNLHFLAEQTVQSAFGYSGQKCSACSIIYLPEDYLDQFIKILKREINKFLFQHENYGLINAESYNRTLSVIKEIRETPEEELTVVIDSEYNNEKTYFVSPLVVECKNHDNMIFNKEFFAPILAIYPYSKHKKLEALKMCTESNNYSLTGSVFSSNEYMIMAANDLLREKTGNFYVNCKSTGSIVGNQPFGGSGKSGTNDKAGDINLLYRLFNQRNLKINYEY